MNCLRTQKCEGWKKLYNERIREDKIGRACRIHDVNEKFVQEFSRKTLNKENSCDIIKSRDSSVGIALFYGLDDRGFRVRFPAGAGNFSFHHRVQNGWGPLNLLSNG
jgi:hypothetical protein